MKELATYKSVGGLLTVGLLTFGITACGGGDNDSAEATDTNNESAVESSGGGDTPTDALNAYIDHLNEGNAEAALALVDNTEGIEPGDIQFFDGIQSDEALLADGDEISEDAEVATVAHSIDLGDQSVNYDFVKRDDGWLLTEPHFLTEFSIGRTLSVPASQTFEDLISAGYVAEYNGEPVFSQGETLFYQPVDAGQMEFSFNISEPEIFEPFEFRYHYSGSDEGFRIDTENDELEISDSFFPVLSDAILSEWYDETPSSDNDIRDEADEVFECIPEMRPDFAAVIDAGVESSDPIAMRNNEVRCDIEYTSIVQSGGAQVQLESGGDWVDMEEGDVLWTEERSIVVGINLDHSIEVE